MSATDELRKLLDERGVEHYDGTDRTLWGYEQTGEDTGIYRFAASEISGGFIQFDMFRITPEQAITATLGAGTCKVIKSELDGQMWVYRHEFSCRCGQRNLFTTDSIPPRYCPNCGRKVEG